VDLACLLDALAVRGVLFGLAQGGKTFNQLFSLGGAYRCILSHV
jgi:hypothetical protein